MTDVGQNGKRAILNHAVPLLNTDIDHKISLKMNDCPDARLPCGRQQHIRQQIDR